MAEQVLRTDKQLGAVHSSATYVNNAGGGAFPDASQEIGECRNAVADAPTGLALSGKQRRSVDLLEENARLAESQRELEAENAFLRNELSKKWTGIAKAGSIADAVLSLYGVVENVQAAADQYIAEVQSLHTVAVHRLQNVERLCAAVETAIQDGSSYSEELGALISYIQMVEREDARAEWLL